MISELDLQSRFVWHKPDNTKHQIYQDIRAQAYEFAKYIAENVPDGREQSLAITKLEEAVFWANAGIARSK